MKRSKIFIWGTLTTKVDGGGRTLFKSKNKKPIAERTIQGIEGEIYEVDENELKRLDKFETRWGYIRVEIETGLFMYVESPQYDRHYWKNFLQGGTK
jgi:gamma-glutamylcyclotransferase (GGCT)/AIG2-like uncharacterized protein YtfP